MNQQVDAKEARRRAFRNVVGSLKLDRLLPDKVFSGAWSDFLFFESDQMFAPEFAEAIGDFLRVENSGVCCLLNLSETDSSEFEKIAAIFLDGMVTGREYETLLRGGGPAVGWLYSMDRYGCASEIGEWCIYCEKNNDIAVVALRSDSGASKFESSLEKLHAKPIEAIRGGELAELFPFSELTSEWRAALIEHYGKGAGSPTFP